MVDTNSCSGTDANWERDSEVCVRVVLCKQPDAAKQERREKVKANKGAHPEYVGLHHAHDQRVEHERQPVREEVQTCRTQPLRVVA